NLADLPSCGGVIGAERAICIPTNDLMVSRSFNVFVERMRPRHINETRSVRVQQCPSFGQHYYLAQLPSRNVVVWAEGAVGIPGQDARVVGRLYVVEEGAAGGHIAEVGVAIGVYGPAVNQAKSQHHNLGDLAARGG